MTYQADCTLPNELPEQVSEQSLDFQTELIRIAINKAMHVEC
jgi:cation transport regulator ChaB